MSEMTKQAEIVNAAQELFNSFGFEKTTMTDIAKRLGISKASLYYYFNDKESIIRSLAIKEQERFVTELQKIISEASNTLERLLAYADKRVELLQKSMTLSSTNSITHKSIRSIFSVILASFWEQEIELVSHIYNLGMKVGDIKEIDIPEHAELFLTILRGLRRNAFYNSNKLELIHLPAEDIVVIKQQSKLFTEIFYKGISK
nr:TetR/AcrR family transcriptional regulator [uncultured Carboxylicivirga sp.]